MTELVFSIFAGVALAAASGFRVFVPMLAVSVGAHAGYVTPGHGFEWLGSWPALVVLGVATVVEIVAYYVPWLDHALDTVATPTAIGAGATVLAAMLPSDAAPALKWTLAVVGGGGTAGVIQAGTVAARALSGVTTAGAANPLISTIEHIASTVLAVLAILVPVLAFVLVLGILYAMGRTFRRIRAKRLAPATPAPGS